MTVMLVWRQVASPATYEIEVRQSVPPQRAVITYHFSPESFWNAVRPGGEA